MSAVRIYVSNKQGFVWNVEDVGTLRASCRVCGSLTGTLPSVSQQNVFLGLPLILMPEEVVLLVEKNLVVLVDDSKSHGTPTKEQLRTWNERRITEVTRQHLEREEKDRRPRPVNLKDDAIAKRLAREAKRAEKQAISAVQTETETIFEDSSDSPDKSQVPASKDAPYWLQIPSTSTREAWYEPVTYTSIEDAQAAGLWEYPSTPREHARCAVFRDLWEQGYFMGSGLKFGGDFLVYPGDPLRYHSHFVATVFPSPTALIRPMDIIAFGRLGTATKKAHLICGWDQDTGEVSYFSIEWANFG